MAAVLWSRSGSFEFDASGEPAVGALAYFFDSGTSTPRTVYTDSALSVPHPHPVVATGNGRWPAVYLPFGDYKYTLKTAGGTTLISIDGISNDEPTDPSDTVDPNKIFQTGDMIFVGGNTTRPGFVRCNGRTMGNAASGGTERANADTSDLFTYIWNNYANGQAAVSGGRGASAAVDYAANKTIALPDQRTAALIGFDDMGNTARAGIDPALMVSGTLITSGSMVGFNTHQLIVSQLPIFTPAGTINQVTGTISQITPAGTISQITPAGTVGITDSGHFHAPPNAGGVFMVQVAAGGIGTISGAAANIANSAVTTTNTTGITASFTGTPVTPTFTGTPVTPTFTGSTPTFTGTAVGSNFAHNIVQRSILVTVLMKL